MKPPYCYLCHQYFDAGKGGDLVEFADYLPLEDGVLGHSRGSEWFCPTHLPAARALASRTSSEALHELRREYGEFLQAPVFEPNADPEPSFLSVLMRKIGAFTRKITRRSPGDNQ